MKSRPGSAGLLGLAWLLGFGFLAGGCYDVGDPADLDGNEALWDLEECEFEIDHLADGGVGFDAIPTISTPLMVDTQASNEIGYLKEDDRVIGLFVAGQALAFPLSALWHHPVVNLDRGGTELVVLHSTLAGASRVFRRSASSGADFGVSGLLYRNNDIIFDRSGEPSLWIQPG